MFSLLPHPVNDLCLQARDRYCHFRDVFPLFFHPQPLYKGNQETGTFVFCIVYSMDKVRAMLMWNAIKWTAVFTEVMSQRKTEGFWASVQVLTLGIKCVGQCVGQLIVLRPVAGFPAVLLLFVSSCFLRQKWDFQQPSASSLYQSRPLWFPSSNWRMLS